MVESEASLGITAVALLEAAHVLSRPPYAHTREAAVDALVALLQRENVRGVGVEDQHAAAALLLCRSSGTVSFGDALIVATGLSAGVAEVYSFDARIGRAGLRPVPLPDPAAAGGPGPP